MNLRLELRLPYASVTTGTGSSPTPLASSQLAHLSRYVSMDGVSPTPLRQLQPGETDEVLISLCLLAEGRFEFGCMAEEIDCEAGREDGRERRRYEGQERLVIVVED